MLTLYVLAGVPLCKDAQALASKQHPSGVKIIWANESRPTWLTKVPALYDDLDDSIYEGRQVIDFLQGNFTQRGSSATEILAANPPDLFYKTIVLPPTVSVSS